MQSMLFMVYLVAQNIHSSIGLKLIDVPQESDQESNADYNSQDSDQTLMNKNAQDLRKHWLKSNDGFGSNEEKEENIKSKIATLIEQTIHDTERKITSFANLKSEYREQAPYKVGFILNLVKKSKDVLNELYNVAIKHKEDWKALEQLKVFELIVHTNVDTTNLVRQLVEIHISHLNSTHLIPGKRRVVLLK